MKAKFRTLTISFVMMFIGMLFFSAKTPAPINFARMVGIRTLKIDHSEISTFGAVSTTENLTNEELTTTINELVTNYYAAKKNIDMKEMKKYVSNIKYVQQQKLLTEAEYVEDYRNFNCLVLNADEGSYRVYAYYYVKIYNVDTLIPSLSALYVSEDFNGDLKIYLGSLNSREQDIINTLDNLDIVKELSRSVQEELNTIIANDQQVKKFYKMLRDMTVSGTEEESNENIDSEAVMATEKPEDDSEKAEESSDNKKKDSDNSSSKKKNNKKNNNKKKNKNKKNKKKNKKNN